MAPDRHQEIPKDLKSVKHFYLHPHISYSYHECNELFAAWFRHGSATLWHVWDAWQYRGLCCAATVQSHHSPLSPGFLPQSFHCPAYMCLSASWANSWVFTTDLMCALGQVA